MSILRESKIYVAGHRGLVGSAIWRRLERGGFTNLIGRTRQELDLINQQAVEGFYQSEKPEYVFVAAARVGGILANSTYPGQFLYENLQIQNHLIHGAHLSGVKKLLFLGSSCIYPKFAPQPIAEDSLLTAPLESSNEWYAIAKIAGIKMCQAYRSQYGCHFISAMPTNLYGTNDNYDPKSSHVLPALIRRFHKAAAAGEKEVVCWGTGNPLREFLHADDLADACLFLMEHYDESMHINVGSGSEITIRELAEIVADITGFKGNVVWDSTKPDGTPRKIMDSSRIHERGWRPTIPLREGILRAYREYQTMQPV